MLFEHDAEKLNFALKRQIQTQKEDNAVNKVSSSVIARFKKTPMLNFKLIIK